MVARKGNGWKLAPSLVAMVAEADEIAPDRNRKADGSIGDAAHRRRKSSDHNPSQGWVTAVDLTHAPASGFDAHARARELVARRDHRLKYVISNYELARSYPKPGIPPWTWAPYTGSNKHVLHAHFSIHNTARARDDLSGWWLDRGDDMTSDQEKKLDRVLALVEGTNGAAGRLDVTVPQIGEAVGVIRAQLGVLIGRDGAQVDVDSIVAAIKELPTEVADEIARRLA